MLQQNALDPADSYCAPGRQLLLLDLALVLYRQGEALLRLGVPVQQLLRLPLLAQARRWRSQYGNDRTEDLEAQRRTILDTFADLAGDYAKAAGPAESEPAA